MSIRLYVGNLPKEEIDRDALANMFAEEGQQITTKVIKDRKTGKCRGFAFVTVENDEFADKFIEKYNGQNFMDSPLKIEKALPRSKGDDTPSAESGNAPKRKNNGKRNKKPSTSGSSQKQSGGSIQPDPRWADELAKLKEMLASANN